MGVNHEQVYVKTPLAKNLKYNIDVGYTYGPNNHLTVVEHLGMVKERKQQFFKVHCPICAQDPELFGEGTFVIAKGHIVEGKSPCGCNTSFRYTKDQCEIRMRRKLEGTDCEFAGWVEDFKNCYSKIWLRNKKTGEVWSTADVDAIMQGTSYTRRGFRPEIPAYFYVLKVQDDSGNHVFTGFGVTNKTERRKIQHRHELKKRGLHMGDFVKYSMLGWDALEIEGRVIEHFPRSGTDVASFINESTLPHYHETLTCFVESCIKEARITLQASENVSEPCLMGD